METLEKLTIERLDSAGRSQIQDIVTRESPLTLLLNGRELVTMLCSPDHLDYLAIGFLAAEGILKGKTGIKNILVDERTGVVRVETTEAVEDAGEMVFKRLITSGCGRGASFYSAASVRGTIKVEYDIKIAAAEITGLVRAFQRRSEVYRATGGVHSAALCQGTDILVFADDIGRHNAVDKVFGECIINGVETEGRLLVTSGRITSEIVLKVARRGIPVLVSRSAPTSLGVKLALDTGVTLVGFVRGERMNIYANGWRVLTDAKSR